MKKYYQTEAGNNADPKRILKLDADEYETVMGLIVVAHFSEEMRKILEKKDLEIVDRLYMQI